MRRQVEIISVAALTAVLAIGGFGPPASAATRLPSIEKDVAPAADAEPSRFMREALLPNGLTPASAVTSAQTTFSGKVITGIPSVPDNTVKVWADGWGELYFAAPDAAPLTPGTYESPDSIWHMTPGHPGMFAYTSWGDCDRGFVGRFTVHEIETAYGVVTKLAADYQQQCQNGTIEHGAFRLDSTVPAEGLSQDPGQGCCSLYMGFAEVGGHRDIPMTLSNAGDTSVELGTIAFSGDDVEHLAAIDDGCSAATLPPRSTCQLTIRYSPVAARETVFRTAIPTSTALGTRVTEIALQAAAPATLVLTGPTERIYPPDTIRFSAQLAPVPTFGPGVSFYLDGQYWNSGQLSESGVAEASIWLGGVGLAPGDHTMRAEYPGGGGVAPTASNTVTFVRGVQTSLQLTSSLNPANVSQPVTITAGVTPSEGAISGGTISIVDAFDGSTIASGPVGGSTTSISVTRAFAIGSHALTASYSGHGPFGPSEETLTQVVGVAWGTTYKAGPAYTWNAGNALARTVQSGTQRLHLAYATSRIGSRWAKDTGPYMGVYYVRSTSGSTWSTPKRLNPSTQHAERPGLAAAGSRVYAVWVSQRRIVKYSPTAPRVLYVRVNTNHGASTSWRSTIRLTSTTGRVDYPTIAAYGSDVHVAWTDAVTGSIKVATSRDRGATWKRLSLGTTSLYDKSGKFGLPAVAVSGSTVAVAWLADKSGTVKVRVSTNRGASWGPIATIGTQSWSRVSVAVRGSRIAVAWASAADLVVRQRIGGTWADPVVAGSVTPTPDDPYLYAPSVVLQDPARVAVAWSEALDAGRERSSLRWAESADGGASWFAPQTLASTSSSRRLNDYASVLWPSAGTRYVVWNGWTPYSTSYRLYLRKGTGAPVGPTSAAPAWVPAVSPGTLVPGAGEDITPLVAPDGRQSQAPSSE